MTADYTSERWATFPPFPRYQISDHGRVRNGDLVLKQSLNSRGYRIVVLYATGRKSTVMVHRAVAACFVSGFSEELQVNHIDGNKKNNVWTNLEWVTPKENTEHGYRVGARRRAEFVPGQRVGAWTLLYRDPVTAWHVHARCDCGAVYVRRLYQILGGRSYACRNCQRSKRVAGPPRLTHQGGNLQPHQLH